MQQPQSSEQSPPRLNVWQRSLHRLRVSGLELIYPPTCLFCRAVGKPLPHFPGICSSCLQQLPLRFADSILPWPAASGHYPPDGVLPGWSPGILAGQLPHVLCACYYQTPVKEALLQLKFGDASEWQVPLASLLVQTVRRSHQAYDGIIAVPLHPSRYRERGYNQAGLLAAQVALALHIPDLSDQLVRVKQTFRQSEQPDRSARWQNLAHAFAVRQPAILAQRQLLLVDDILTTGATLTAAASPLWRAGSRVTGLVVASNHQA